MEQLKMDFIASLAASLTQSFHQQPVYHRHIWIVFSIFRVQEVVQLPGDFYKYNFNFS